MTQTRLTLLAFVLLGLLILAYQSIFILNQTQQALVLQFGDIKRVEQEPGLKFKVPFIQNVLFFDKRLLEFNADSAEFITKDREQDVEERVVIDAFVRYRIIDPVAFYQAVRNESGLKSRLEDIVTSNMRKVLATVSLSDLLSERRHEIMQKIQRAVNIQVTRTKVDAQGIAIEPEVAREGLGSGRGFGIEVVDVRIMRADLPQDISQATFERMRKNFTKEAQKFRAEGEEVALQIRSKADREKVEIIAEAQKKSETIRGEGDSIATKTYANAFNQDRDFFEFYRTMQAYKKTLGKNDTTVVLSPNSEFMEQFDR